MGGTLDHPYFEQEVERQERLRSKYLRLREKYPDMTAQWWFDTHGIDVTDMLALNGR